MKTSGAYSKILDSNGDVVNFSILAGYMISDTDETGGTYNYYGFVDADGNWYISQNTKTNTAIRYFAGTSGYTTNWGNRTTLLYDYFYAIF